MAHKAIESLADVEISDSYHVAGLVVFGDPNLLWEKTEVPSYIQVHSKCIAGTYPDLLCTQSLPKIPTSIDALKDPWTTPPSIVPDGNIKEAILKTGELLLSELPSNFGSFIRQFGFRVMLLPQHFMYGSNGMAKESAAWVRKLTRVAAALA